jgi:flagellin-like hook-associated protein FlgL
MSVQQKTPESKTSAPEPERVNHGDIGMEQAGSELARKIGARNASEIAAAAREGHKCRGWDIKRRKLTKEDREVGGYSGHTKYAYWAVVPGGSNPKAKSFADELAKKGRELRVAEVALEELQERLEDAETALDGSRSRVTQLEVRLENSIEFTSEVKDLLEACEAQVRDRDLDSTRMLSDALMAFYKKSKFEFTGD